MPDADSVVSWPHRPSKSAGAATLGPTRSSVRGEESVVGRRRVAPELVRAYKGTSMSR